MNAPTNVDVTKLSFSDRLRFLINPTWVNQATVITPELQAAIGATQRVATRANINTSSERRDVHMVLAFASQAIFTYIQREFPWFRISVDEVKEWIADKVDPERVLDEAEKMRIANNNSVVVHDLELLLQRMFGGNPGYQQPTYAQPAAPVYAPPPGFRLVPDVVPAPVYAPPLGFRLVPDVAPAPTAVDLTVEEAPA